MTTLLKGHKARIEQQIERQSSLIRSGDNMLRNAANELKHERLDSARVSISGARSAFSRASGESNAVSVFFMSDQAPAWLARHPTIPIVGVIGWRREGGALHVDRPFAVR